MKFPLSFTAISQALQQQTITSAELVQHLHNKAVAANEKLNCFINLTPLPAVLENAKFMDTLRTSLDASELPMTLGIPIAYKDNICVKNITTTCASKMLENFVAPYNATLVGKASAQGFVNLGKTNMDEFAMGASNETSYFGNCLNPWSLTHVPGGSSGGSAAAVAARLVPAAIGTDTGGSVRQPASFCGICGLKPTYGRISRRGVVAFASSLDQAGPMATSAEDCAHLFDVISGPDPQDATTLRSQPKATVAQLNNDIAGLVLGLPKQLFAQKMDDAIRQNLDNCIAELTKLGVTFKEVTIPNHKYAIPTYYIIATAEASSNLSRFDGIRYGYKAPDCATLEEMYTRTRTEGFGDEVKRRILTGTFVLSSGYYDAYYNKAQITREQITADYRAALAEVDVIFAPTTATTAHKVGFKNQCPQEKYNSDQFTVSANLARLPALAFPTGFDEEGLPTSAQLIGNSDCEGLILNIAHQYQQVTDWHTHAPQEV